MGGKQVRCPGTIEWAETIVHEGSAFVQKRGSGSAVKFMRSMPRWHPESRSQALRRRRSRGQRRTRRAGRGPGRRRGDEVDGNLQQLPREDRIRVGKVVVRDDVIHGTVELGGDARQRVPCLNLIVDDRAACEIGRDGRRRRELEIRIGDEDLLSRIDALGGRVDTRAGIDAVGIQKQNQGDAVIAEAELVDNRGQ